MTTLPQIPESTWYKSTYSQGSGASCVEVARGGGAVGVRDSTRRAAGRLAVPAAAFAAFLAAARHGGLPRRP